MTNIVIQLTADRLKELAQAYQPYQIPNKDPNKVHFFKVGAVTVSTYKSGKVVFQGAGAQDLAQKWGTLDSAKSYSKIDNQLSTIGSDEVGNGSYFGGLAVVASLVEPDQIPRLKALGVGDSKTLTDDKIRQIAPILEAEIQHQALLLSPQKYNEIIPSRYNAVSVKVALHNQAIFLLLQKVTEPDQIIIDAFTSPSNYHRYLEAESNRFSNPIQLVEKAESQCFAVAVSSIIARAIFLKQLEDLGHLVGCKLPSGAGSASDKTAAKLLSAHGRSALSQTAKLHFKNTEKAEKIRKNYHL